MEQEITGNSTYQEHLIYKHPEKELVFAYHPGILKTAGKDESPEAQALRKLILFQAQKSLFFYQHNIEVVKDDWTLANNRKKELENGKAQAEYEQFTDSGLSVDDFLKTRYGFEMSIIKASHAFDSARLTYS